MLALLLAAGGSHAATIGSGTLSYTVQGDQVTGQVSFNNVTYTPFGGSINLGAALSQSPVSLAGTFTLTTQTSGTNDLTATAANASLFMMHGQGVFTCPGAGCSSGPPNFVFANVTSLSGTTVVSLPTGLMYAVRSVPGAGGGCTPNGNGADCTVPFELDGFRSIRTLPGFAANLLPPNDDDSTGLVPIGFQASFFGHEYTEIFVNNNGNVTFDDALGEYTPFDLTHTQRVIIAPFFADIDTDNLASNVVTYGVDTIDGHSAFGVNWIKVGYFASKADKLNTFQLVLIDRSDLNPGNFDIEFNYDSIQWETGDASNGHDGLGGSSARAGFSNGTGDVGTFFELPGSAVNGGLLDTNPDTGLANVSRLSDVPGRQGFPVRNGVISLVDLALSKMADPTHVHIGDAVTYTLTAHNNGPGDASSITILDTLPSGTQFQSASPGCTNQDGTITCAIPSLASGQEQAVTITVTAISLGSIDNQASVQAAEPDPHTADNSAEASITVGCRTDDECDDHNLCTVDTCDVENLAADLTGCVHTPAAIACPPAECHGAGVCDPATGACTGPPLTGTPCDDGNGCTRTDVCQDGVCVGTDLVTCGGAGSCGGGVCDPATGRCSGTPAPDGTSCSDGNVCNGQEICQAGRCATPSRAAALACENQALVAFVTDFNDNAISFLPVASTSVAATASVGAGPWAVAIRPLANELFTTNRQAGSVSVLDGISRAVVATIPVGATPLGIVINAAGTRAWVASYDANSISVIDTASRSVAATIPVGPGPAGLTLNAGGTRLYVSNYAAGTVSVVDTATNGIIRTIGVGAQPLELGVDEAKGRLYVANYGSDTVTVIGTLSNSVLTTVAVGSKPFGVAIDSAASRAYVSNASSDVVSVLDTGINQVLTTIPVGRAPFGIDLDRTGGRAFVVNAGANTVSVINTASASVVATVPVGNLPIAFGDFVGVIASHCGAAGLGTCDDADPFTIDTCSPNVGCQHAGRGGQGDLTIGLTELASDVRSSNLADLGGSKSKSLLQQLVNGALSQLGTPTAVAADLLTPLDHASPRVSGVARRRLKRIARALKLFVKAVEKGIRKKTIQRDLGWGLLDLARANQNTVNAALGIKPSATARPSAAAATRNPPLPPFDR